MAKALLIVESPAKARTISRLLGRSVTVKASMGHVRDLPRSQFGVDIQNNFTPKYITIRGKGEIVQELRASAKKAQEVYLATDPDREGEAISWHLASLLNLDPNRPCRIQFHEITKNAITAALEKPRPIDYHLVNAQQARRILDRIVGYELSPLLWEKVKYGLSAGRVQSVAVRLICDREREIQAFQPQEYWTIDALLSTPARGETFIARLVQKDGEKANLPDEEAARRAKAELEKAHFRVVKVEKKERRRFPSPPFITSTLQQEASRRLGFSARRTMQLAQQLYEGLEVEGEGLVGLITYIRTDSVHVAAEAQKEAARLIEEYYGPTYQPDHPPHYKSREGAQEAHECIRPTSVWRAPEKLRASLKRDQWRLYRLIWERFVASQMAPALLESVGVEITADRYLLRATGSVLKFPGFLRVYSEAQEEEPEEEKGRLPELEEGQELQLMETRPEQHFTQPPPRYTEAALIKAMEELGIGRPSTYAPIIETIRQRGYVEMKERHFVPTELGFVVTDLLREYFPRVVDVDFTAELEDKLDAIEEGKADWVQILREFYGPFQEALQRAQEKIEKISLPAQETDVPCPACGRHLVVKRGRFGEFLACPGFPECRYTRPLLKSTGAICPRCGGEIVERRSRRGRVFYGCSNYPTCGFTTWLEPVSEKCPRCGSFLTVRRRRGRAAEYTCANEECGYRRTAQEAQVQ